MNSLPLGTIVKGDALAVLRTFPDASVQCCVSSFPYWGLRDYGLAGQAGLEATPELHVAWAVEVSREIRRVLRDDGVFWLNYGDCYAGSWGAQSREGYDDDSSTLQGGSTLHARQIKAHPKLASGTGSMKRTPGLKPKDLVGMPWRVAFALQADGWYLRADCIWAKPNPMPESVTDRPTKSHEYVFLLSKRARYFYDAEAVREDSKRDDLQPIAGWATGDGEHTAVAHARGNHNGSKFDKGKTAHGKENVQKGDRFEASGRNLRTVWEIATQPYPGAHFATFPEALVERCIRAGTSERGACPACGAPWVRVVEKPEAPHGPANSKYQGNGAAARMAQVRDEMRRNGKKHDNPFAGAQTVDWRPSCECPIAEPVPCIVLDPFAGSGTTGLVAHQLERDFVGIDLAGGDKDLGGHTAHDRLKAGKMGRPWKEHVAHQAAGQGELLGVEG